MNKAEAIKVEKFRYLAGVIAAHEGRKLPGRTRLQKTMKLLQRLNFPTDYSFRLFFYGPYSDGIKSDLGLLEVLDLAEEEEKIGPDGSAYYVISANSQAELPQIKPFEKQIKLMENSSLVPLELAATYDSFRETGSDHAEALERLKRKKGSKCTEDNVSKALNLLNTLELPHR